MNAPLSALKHATRDAHRDVERLVPLLDPRLTRATYVRYLERALGFHAPLEATIAGVAALSSLLPDVGVRRRAPLLVRDLTVLGADPDSVPRCAPPSLTRVDEAFGCLYVLEGSTLGGRLLTRHVERVLGIGPEGGGAFLAAYGEEVGAMWTRFGAAFTLAAGDATFDLNRAIAAAHATFAAFGAWLANEPFSAAAPRAPGVPPCRRRPAS